MVAKRWQGREEEGGACVEAAPRWASSALSCLRPELRSEAVCLPGSDHTGHPAAKSGEVKMERALQCRLDMLPEVYQVPHCFDFVFLLRPSLIL